MCSSDLLVPAHLVIMFAPGLWTPKTRVWQFPDEVPLGLPPKRGIEHQIDLVSGASLPNRAAYRTNLEETKEIQQQVEELIKKGMYKKVFPLVLSMSF